MYTTLIFRFCVGDRFYLCENKILCEYDFEERMVFANMAYNPATLAQLKRHATHIPPSVRTCDILFYYLFTILRKYNVYFFIYTDNIIVII